MILETSRGVVRNRACAIYVKFGVENALAFMAKTGHRLWEA